MPEIKASYDWFIGQYERQAQVLSASNDLTAIDRLDIKRDIFERGIFVLMFAQFEVAVNHTFEAVMSKRLGDDDWSRRRGWDADTLKGPRVSFHVRLCMVMDRRNPEFGQINKNYALRNHCAHGGTTEPVGSIDDFEHNLYRWQSFLRD
ncbi:hypothetical protein [Pararhizobium sp.]|uniref:hypothetical protein n=1 Tax=Pararhizobium sp. TaxID=1977563 RepID=UPI002717B6B1|nr:hypothetical protein [Pararhizobium sp.]MDO9416295.1 hypothetical protein [Pararhizobium sp.]